MGKIGDIFKRTKPVLWDIPALDRLLLMRYGAQFSRSEPKFNPYRAYDAALSIAEIFYPIDLIADIVSSLDYRILDDNDNVVDRVPSNIERILDKPNVFSSFSQMIYDAVFISLSDGNLLGYRNIPSALADKPAVLENIYSIQILRPDTYSINIQTDASPFFAKDITELIRSVSYSFLGRQYELSGSNLVIMGSSGFPREDLRYPSPLEAVSRNIENLMAVYQARYNIYTKNGMGGILTRKMTGNSASALSIEDVVRDPVTRDDILNDILNRYGPTGEKLMWGVSSVPLEFVRTLATISELQPFDETQEDAMQIAGVMSVDKDLLPMKEGVTYDNKDSAMLRLYTGPVKTQAEDKAKFFTELLCLDQIGLRLSPDLTNIEVLQKEKAQKTVRDTQVVDLLVKLKSEGLISDADLLEITDGIINTYKS